MPAVRHAAFAVAALALALTAGAGAQPGAERDPAQTGWDALKPASGFQFEDPFSALTRDQLRDLSALARMLQQGSKPDDGTESGQAVAVLYARLAEQDVDADGLLSRRQEIAEKRRKAAMQVNPGIVGQDIEIVGFPIAAALANGDASSFFLVPSPGICSHVTLPPPNQIILVTTDAPQGQLDFRAPVRVKGAISNVAGQRDVFLVDGRAIVEHAYRIVRADISIASFAAGIKPAWSVGSPLENVTTNNEGMRRSP